MVFELTRRLPERGFDVHVIAMMGGGRLISAFADAKVPTSAFLKTGPFGSFGFFPVLRRLRELRPDILHTHLFGADLWGRLAALFAGVRVVVSTEHNIFPSEGWLTRALKRFLAFHSSAVIAVSKAVKRRLVENDRIPPRKVRFVPNGVDLSLVVPRSARPFRDVPRLIAVGRLEPQKGIATLLKALALVKRPWTLDVVGAGTLERELRSLAERLALAPRVRWLGVRNDVPALLAASDLFCFPSLWEGFGLAVAEAAAAGVPVVSSDLDVLREVLADDAEFVPPGDVPALAHAIDAILRDPIPHVARAELGVSRIRAAYSVDKMVKGTAALYNELLSKGVGRRA